MEKCWTIEHQGFSSGHPWRLSKSGELVARVRTQELAKAYAENEDRHDADRERYAEKRSRIIRGG
jgi:hypothetical protein